LSCPPPSAPALRPTDWPDDLEHLSFLPPQWRSRGRRISGEDESRLSRKRKAIRYLSIVPQPPGGRGDQRHCGAARGSKEWLLLTTPWSGVAGGRPSRLSLLATETVLKQAELIAEDIAAGK